MEFSFDLSTWLLIASLAGLFGGVGMLLVQREEGPTSGQPSRSVMLIPPSISPAWRNRGRVFRRKQPSVKDSSSDDEQF
ncbi:MAG: hypothetical protein K0R67_3777 [Paenibacillus sp.]|nr:hypothetical protein [Paenibacillus sp.]